MDEVARGGAIEVPGYTVGERIGAGGFGEVFRARHAVIGRDAAIKVLHGKYSADPEAVSRFVAEARAVGKLSHPGIVEIFDFGQLPDGRQYCVMELIEGQTLRELLRERGRMPLADALPVLRGIAEAIDAAHAARIAHRDLKPDNVFVTAAGVKVIDFGLAKLTHEDAAPVTQTGSVFGTPLYMSPEQCRGKATTTATDAYSFGVLAYQILTGEPPFRGEAIELALHHVNDAPEPPSKRCRELDARVDRAVLALLAKDPAARPELLVPAVEAMTGGALPIRRRARWIAAAIAVAISAGVATAVIGWRSRAETGLRARNVTFTPDSVNAEPMFSPDGKEIYFADASGAWEQDLATGIARHPDVDLAGAVTISPVGDGRFVIERNFTLELVDPAAKTRTPLGDGQHPRVSPDGRHVAALRNNHYIVIDLVTRDTVELMTAEHPVFPLHWKPDSTAIVWIELLNSTDAAEEPAVHITRLADRFDRVIKLPLLRDGQLIGPTELLDATHLVYCANDSTIRIHDLEAPRSTSDRIVAPLDASVSGCAFEASRDRRRLLVVLSHARGVAAELAIDPVAREWKRVVGESTVPGLGAVVAYAGHDAIVDESWSPLTLAPVSALAIRRVSQDGHATPLHVCPGDIGVVRRGETLLHVMHTNSVLQLADDQCAALDRWELPAGGKWSLPTCAAASCVSARTDDQGTSIWRFEHRALTATRVADLPHFPGGIGVAAIAPDGSRIAATGGGGPVFEIDATGHVETRTLAGQAQCVRWLDARSYVVSGFLGQPLPFWIRRVNADGSQDLLWSSANTWACVTAMSDDHRVVGGTMRANKRDLLLLER